MERGRARRGGGGGRGRGNHAKHGEREDSNEGGRAAKEGEWKMYRRGKRNPDPAVGEWVGVYVCVCVCGGTVGESVYVCV